MEYFIMKTDKRLLRLPQLQMSDGQLRLEMLKEKTTIVYVKKEAGLSIDYAEYLEKPVPMVADRFKNILKKYQKDVLFHRVVLIERESGMQKPYYIMMPPQVACADKEESRFDAMGNVKEFVLDMEKAGRRRIFLAEDYGKKMLVRLDAAESILRRNADGIWFEPVRVSERSRKNVK